jgi:hypothetical protein
MLRWLNATLWWYGLQWQASEGACRFARWLIPPMVWRFMIGSIIPRDGLELLIGSNLGFWSTGILLGPKLCQYAIVVQKTCSLVCYFTTACIFFNFIWSHGQKGITDWWQEWMEGMPLNGAQLPSQVMLHWTSIVVYDRIIMISLHELNYDTRNCEPTAHAN